MAVHRDQLIDDEENEDDDDDLFQVENALNLALDLADPLRPILAAARSGDAEALAQTLDDNDGSIDEPLEDGDTALHLACLYGYSSCVRLLLERGANIEVKDEDGAIPLHDACAGVQLLLNHANDAEAVKRMLETMDDEGDTPLHHAARGEHTEVVNLLLASGASVTQTNSYGKTPSELADPETEARRILEASASSQ